MLRKLFIFVLCFVATISASQAQAIPNNEIWYTTTGGKIAELTIGRKPMVENGSDFKIISHTYENGKGIIRANKAIKAYGIEEYGEVGFMIDGDIKSVTLPKSLTSIGWCAFEGCSSLTSITIPDSVTWIDNYAFKGCSSLTSVTIPDSVTTIGEDAFSGCVNLPVIDNIRYADTYLVEAVDKSQTSYAIKEGTRLIGVDAFSGCRSLTSVTIPNGITTIGNAAFNNCSSLTSITIPDSVTTIGSGAFADCSSLTSVTIPDSVTTIENEAFYLCSSLTSVTIPDSVTSIGGCAFDGCSNLRSITIPDCVTSIGDGAFDGSNIQSVTIDVVTGDVSYIKEMFRVNKIAGYTGKYASVDGLCIIKDGILLDFLNKGQSEYSIPNSVTTIGDKAFSRCSRLTSVTIPDSVTTIGKGAFKYCSSLTSITIPDSVTSIGDRAFDGCNIQSVTIDVVTGDVSYIKEMFGANKIAGYTGKYASADGLCIIKDGVLLDFLYKGQSEYSIPDGVTTIEKELFKDCNNLTTITIPDSVAEIGNGSFSGCSSLAKVVCLASTPPAIDDICVSEIMLIYVPKEYVRVYKKDPKWSIYKKHIKPIK